MLVLTRHRDETIVIGDNIEITVVDIKGDKVRVGITAPKEIQVHRKEVYEAIQRDRANASKVKVNYISNNPIIGGANEPPSAKRHYSPLGGMIYS